MPQWATIPQLLPKPISARIILGAARFILNPGKLDDVEAIALRLESPTRKHFPKEHGGPASLASHLQMRPAEYLASIKCLLSGKEHGELLWYDPWLALPRNSSSQGPRRDIMLKLEFLKKKWQVEVNGYHVALQQCKRNDRGERER